MKKRKYFMILGVMLIALFALTGCGEKAKIKKLEKSLSDANSNLTEVTQERDALKEEVDSITQERDSLQSQLSSMTEERDSLTKQISEMIDAETEATPTQTDATPINLIFPIDGKKYSGGEKVTYYTDPQLSERVGTGDEITFVSKVKQEVTVDSEKELKVWVARSESGFLYSANKPNLKEIKSEG